MPAKIQELDLLSHMHESEIETVYNCVKECVNAQIRIEGEKAFIADVVSRLKDEVGLSKATINELIKAMWDEQYADNTYEHAQMLYSAVESLRNLQHTSAEGDGRDV